MLLTSSLYYYHQYYNKQIIGCVIVDNASRKTLLMLVFNNTEIRDCLQLGIKNDQSECNNVPPLLII